MNLSCIQTIRSRYADLTAAEQKIADCILAHGAAVPQWSAAELAAHAGAAPSAVIRCCKSLGLRGYADLKLQLAAEFAKNRQLNYAPYIDPADDDGAILDKVFAATVKSLHDTAERLDRAALSQLIARMADARRIYLYAVGTSATLASEFCYRLMTLGYTAFAFTDVPSMKVSTLNIGSGDLAIGISHTGRTVATLDAMALAQSAGADTACICGYPDSPLAQQCDVALAISSDELQYPVEAMSARVAMLSLIDGITIALSARHYDDTVRRAQQIHALVDSVRRPGQVRSEGGPSGCTRTE